MSSKPSDSGCGPASSPSAPSAPPTESQFLARLETLLRLDGRDEAILTLMHFRPAHADDSPSRHELKTKIGDYMFSTDSPAWIDLVGIYGKVYPQNKEKVKARMLATRSYVSANVQNPKLARVLKELVKLVPVAGMPDSPIERRNSDEMETLPDGRIDAPQCLRRAWLNIIEDLRDSECDGGK